jgi:TRIAP1/MDM35 family protein
MSSSANVADQLKLSSEQIKQAVEDVTAECSHFKERYGKCQKNWQRKSMMRGGDMRYACDEFYDEFRACVVERLSDRGIHDVPFFGVSAKSSIFK